MWGFLADFLIIIHRCAESLKSPHICTSSTSKCLTRVNHKNMQFSWVKNQVWVSCIFLSFPQSDIIYCHFTCGLCTDPPDHWFAHFYILHFACFIIIFRVLQWKMWLSLVWKALSLSLSVHPTPSMNSCITAVIQNCKNVFG